MTAEYWLSTEQKLNTTNSKNYDIRLINRDI